MRPIQWKAALVLTCAILVTGVAGAAAAQDSAQKALAVMPLQSRSLPADKVAILDNIVVTSVSELDAFRVVSASDVQAVLGLERMKEAIGCSDLSCAAEIGGALGVDYLLVATVDSLGSSLILTASLLDIQSTAAVTRKRVQAKDDEDAYIAAVDSLVRKTFESFIRARSPEPTPPQPAAGTSAAPEVAATENAGELSTQAEAPHAREAPTGPAEFSLAALVYCYEDSAGPALVGWCSAGDVFAPVYLGVIAFSAVPRDLSVILGVSLAYNRVGGDFRGLAQITAGYNRVEGNFKGLAQLGLVNRTGDTVYGGQGMPLFFLPALYNEAKVLVGVQYGVVNRAEETNGVQVGGLNFAEEARGVQIGLMNWANALYGIQIGVLNYNGNGITLPIVNVGF